MPAGDQRRRDACGVETALELIGRDDDAQRS
jgi:hypothetical protein